MKITKRHRAVAEALYIERLRPEQVHSRFRVTPKTLARWQADPDFRALMAEIEAEHRERARRVFVTFAETAAVRLVKVTDTENPETVRKACLDVLARADLGGRPGGSDGDAPADLTDEALRALCAAILARDGRNGNGRDRTAPPAAQGAAADAVAARSMSWPAVSGRSQHFVSPISFEDHCEDGTA